MVRGELSPECFACAEPYTIKHVLLECADLGEIRKRYYDVVSLKALFEDVAPAVIFGFLKEINLFGKL